MAPAGDPMIDQALFLGLPHAPARLLLAQVCTRPAAPLPDDLLAQATDGPAGTWLLGAASRTALAGLLWSSLAPHQRPLLPPAFREALSDMHLVSLLRGEAMQRLLHQCLALLAEAEVPVVLLKGAALAQSLYGSPAERWMSDLDLLVPDGRLSAARLALQPIVRNERPTRPYCPHLGTMLLPGEYASVEVHGSDAHLDCWPQAQPGDPFVRALPLAVGDRSALALSPVDQFLHLACHGVCHAFPGWPKVAADLARLVRADSWSHEHWHEAWEAAERSRRCRAIAVAAAFTSGGSLPEELLPLTPSPLARDAVSAARLAWRAAFDAEPTPTEWLHRAWMRDSLSAQVVEAARYTAPPLAHVARRLCLPVALAAPAYPAYVAARSVGLAVKALRWRRGLRRWSERLAPAGWRPSLLGALRMAPRVLLLLFRLRRLHARLGLPELVQATTPGSPFLISAPHLADAASRLARRLVRRMPRLFPQPCLYYGLAAYHFQRAAGREAVLHCGARRRGDRDEFHAWLSVNGEPYFDDGEERGFVDLWPIR